mmetsp:Transcript_46687/g.99690  ORF Transcript_46687/g.99690 Transcript_46687/m.99690 type:complete len:211 (-) Transcript_46687:93-725(-)
MAPQWSFAVLCMITFAIKVSVCSADDEARVIDGTSDALTTVNASTYSCGMLVSMYDDKACRPMAKEGGETKKACSGKCVRVKKPWHLEKSCGCDNPDENCDDVRRSPVPGRVPHPHVGSMISVKVEVSTGHWWYQRNGFWEDAGEGSFVDAKKYVISPSRGELSRCLEGKRYFGIRFNDLILQEGGFDYCDARIVYAYHHFCMKEDDMYE